MGEKRLNRYWSYLEPGDVVDLVAPGFAPQKKEMNAAVRFLRSWNLCPRVSPLLLGSDALFSNSDRWRARLLIEALLASDSKVVWCLRGGYGSNRLLPILARTTPPFKNKLLIGYSDVTSLHLFLNQKWKWATLHGPVLDGIGSGRLRARDLKELRSCLFGEKRELQFDEFKPLNTLAKKKRKIEASLAGGNLTTWASAIGTPWAGQPKNKILFFEDIGEQGRRVDRMLVQMAQSGGFEGVKAVIFGDFIGGAQPNGIYLWKQVLAEFAQSSPFPVFHGFPAGHGQRQRPLPLGPKVTLYQGGSHPRLLALVGSKK